MPKLGTRMQFAKKTISRPGSVHARKSGPKLAFLFCLLNAAGCQEAAPPPAATGPQRWHEQTPGQVAADVASIDAAALAGNQQAVKAGMERAQDHFRQSIKLPDASKPIDKELARAAAKRVAGVRSVVWLDRENLFAIVEKNEQKSQRTIDEICMQLEPLGDTLAVVVNLQSGAATTSDDLQILSRNCQLQPGDRAFLQSNRQVDVLSPAVRAEQKANNGR